MDTLLGVIAGFFLSQAATLTRYWFTARRRNHSLRTTLQIEMDRNLELLDLYWKRANEDAFVKRYPLRPNPDTSDLQYFAMTLGHAIISSYFPNWSHLMLESQLPHIASALTPEEIKNVHAFHWRLDSLTTVLNSLETMENYYIQKYGVPWAPIGGRSRDDGALPVVEEFKCIVGEILTKGNPLAPKHPQSIRARFHLFDHSA